MTPFKKFLSVVLAIALVAGVAVLSAGAIRSDIPAGMQAGSAAPWWQGLPGFVQWMLRYLFFGWIWMKPVVPVESTTWPPTTPPSDFTNQTYPTYATLPTDFNTDPTQTAPPSQTTEPTTTTTIQTSVFSGTDPTTTSTTTTTTTTTTTITYTTEPTTTTQTTVTTAP